MVAVRPAFYTRGRAPLAQLVEQRTLNPQVLGSIPRGRTTHGPCAIRCSSDSRRRGAPTARVSIASTREDEVSDHYDDGDDAPRVCDSCGVALSRCECEWGAVERSWDRLDDDE